MGKQGVVLANYIGHRAVGKLRSTKGSPSVSLHSYPQVDDDNKDGNDNGISKKSAYIVETAPVRESRFNVWEAARATSAAPTYFSPFCTAGGWECWDGCLLFNNPAKVALSEHQRLWRPAAGTTNSPDILLSVGSGAAIIGSTLPDSGWLSKWKSLFKVSRGYVYKMMNAEDQWATHFGNHKNLPIRFVRINPTFPTAVPSADDAVAMQDSSMERNTRLYLETEEAKQKITDRRTIRCRFINGSDTAKNFAEAVLTRYGTPSFVLAGSVRPGWKIEDQDVTDMQASSIFSHTIEFCIPGDLEEFDLRLHLPQVKETPTSLSGSPMLVQAVREVLA